MEHRERCSSGLQAVAGVLGEEVRNRVRVLVTGIG